MPELKPDFIPPIAKAITDLINSRPRSPTIEELQALLRDTYLASFVSDEQRRLPIEMFRWLVEKLVPDLAARLHALINSRMRSPTLKEIRDVLVSPQQEVPCEQDSSRLRHAMSPIQIRGVVKASIIAQKRREDVEHHYRQRVVSARGSNITVQDLYDDYCDWCEEQGKEALPMPTYSREFKTLGVRKDKMGGRVRYFDVELKGGIDHFQSPSNLLPDTRV
jgi:hypothetical protein